MLCTRYVPFFLVSATVCFHLGLIFSTLHCFHLNNKWAEWGWMSSLSSYLRFTLPTELLSADADNSADAGLEHELCSNHESARDCQDLRFHASKGMYISHIAEKHSKKISPPTTKCVYMNQVRHLAQWFVIWSTLAPRHPSVAQAGSQYQSLYSVSCTISYINTVKDYVQEWCLINVF